MFSNCAAMRAAHGRPVAESNFHEEVQAFAICHQDDVGDGDGDRFRRHMPFRAAGPATRATRRIFSRQVLDAHTAVLKNAT